MNRRSVLAGLSAVGLTSVAGCLGMVGLDEHRAAAAGVEASAREETGYDQTDIEEVVVDRSVGFGPISEEIRVTNQLVEHEKAVDMGPLGQQRGAVFMTLSSPQISILGQQLNPVEDMSSAELVELVEDNYDEIRDIELDEEASTTILDQETIQSRFTASAEFDGLDVDVYLHVSESVEMEGDLVVTIGVYPQQLRGQEEENIQTLMQSVTADFEETDSSGNGDGDDDDDSDDSESDDDPLSTL